MLEIGAFFMRTETELILKSRKVVPTRLLTSGFEFDFKTIGEAIENLANARSTDNRTPNIENHPNKQAITTLTLSNRKKTNPRLT